MDDFAPPPGAPPPKAPEVPAGWVARWNDQYKEWFYVNVYTKKSQWEKPTAPVFPVDENAPSGPPPGYEAGKTAPVATDTKKNPYENPTDEKTGTVPHGPAGEEEDARLAARLQAEEDARAARGGPAPPAGYGVGGSADSYAQGYPGSQHPQQQQQQQQQQFPSDTPPRDDSRSRGAGGILGKLFGKGKHSQHQQNYYSSPPPQQGPPPMGGGYGYGGYPQQAYGAYPQQAYGQPGYGGGAYGPPGGYQQQQVPGRKPGMGGMGMGLAGGAMGLGAGVLGGALIADAIHDHDQEEYMQGYQDGQDNDYGGGDFDDGGGDFGGDF
ncbi:hypothetical protein E4U41_002757 [Claviceps citrina]|nr:hypothetical protein E4U41_002757 [Claviceps citrina]